MAKAKAGVLKALARKKVVLHGRFPWGVEDRLKAMAEAQQGELVADLDGSVDYLVLADLTGGKTVQKKMMGLNAKGASIQVMDADAFLKMLEPTAQQVLDLLRSGEAACRPLGKIVEGMRRHYYAPNSPPVHSVAGESFDGLKLPEIDLNWIAFDRCTFDGADISKLWYPLDSTIRY